MTSPPNRAESTAFVQNRRLLRTQLMAAREAMTPQARERATGQVQKHLDAWLAAHAPHARTVALYSPHRGEVDLHAWARARREQFALPVVVGKDQPLGFAAWQPGDPTEADLYGIAVPQQIVHVRPDVLLIPCVGFNPQRLRVGYGGGYYDRTLAALQPRPLAVGIAFAAQQCNFDAAAHDVALDAIITDNGVV